jgi:hypothetical protein
MWINWKPDANFFEKLARIDRDCMALFRRTGCTWCRGALHRADYPRKPRGWLEAAGETMGKRFSLCCGRRGCRKRLTPPSVRFLGRKVYFGAMVLVASIVWMLTALVGRLVADVPARTVGRWMAWWREVVPTTALWRTVSGHFQAPLPEHGRLPLSLLERFGGDETERIHRALALLRRSRPNRHRA